MLFKTTHILWNKSFYSVTQVLCVYISDAVDLIILYDPIFTRPIVYFIIGFIPTSSSVCHSAGVGNRLGP